MFISLFRDFKQEAVTVELSADYDVGIRDMRFSMKIGNFGSSVKFVNEIYEMPTNFSFGLSGLVLEYENSYLLGSSSINKPNDGPPIGLVGFEYGINKMVFLRSGYNLGHSTATWSTGGGIKMKLSNHLISTDISFNDYSSLGIVTRLGLNIHL